MTAPTAAERDAGVRACARLGLQPTALDADDWFDIALRAESRGWPTVYPADAYLEMAVLATRFPGATFH
jgi:hypothetical protein